MDRAVDATARSAAFQPSSHPYERTYSASKKYNQWWLDRFYLLVPAQAYVANFPKSFKAFPPRQEAASFNLEKVMKQLMTPAGPR